MKEFWNERFAETDYVYGTEPNVFFKQTIDTLAKGRILLAAEGEGRNAVYAARQGWTVDAVDYSVSGQKKALQLAQSKGVSINYQTGNLLSYPFQFDYYDAVSITYLHTPSLDRTIMHHRLLKVLKKGGLFFGEVFDKKQINLKSGGPRSLDMLYSKDELTFDFLAGEIMHLEQVQIELNEGAYHQGIAEVLRFVVRKK